MWNVPLSSLQRPHVYYSIDTYLTKERGASKTSARLPRRLFCVKAPSLASLRERLHFYEYRPLYLDNQMARFSFYLRPISNLPR